MAEGVHVSLLHDIFDFVLTPQHDANDAIQTLIVSTHQHFEERCVAANDSFNNCLIVDLGGLCALLDSGPIEEAIMSQNFVWIAARVAAPSLLWRLQKTRLAVQASAHVVQGANVELCLERAKGIQVIEVFRSVAELEIAADRKRHNLELRGWQAR